MIDKPLIGITAYPMIWPETGWPYDASYAGNARAIERAGGLPILIPAHLSDDTLRVIYERVDAVLLPGGGDVDPKHYGAQPHPTTAHINALRDRTELALARWAVAEDRPILGICRGHQLLNVAMGGTLIQDISSQTHTHLKHDTPFTTPRSAIIHDVHIAPDSRLAQIIGDTKIPVNSIHHQAVDVVAPSARVVAQSADGIVEALELPQKTFALSVQWHPEDMENEAMHRLFTAFVEAARQSARLRQKL